MALAEYINQTLDGLLNGYVNEINRLKGLTTDDFVKKSLDGYIKTYSEIMGAMKKVSQQSGEPLDPKVNQDLWNTLGNFISKALKDNDNPSQLYGKILDVYNQEIFSRRDEVNVILLSKIYMDAFYVSRNINPITKQYDRNISREDKEEAAKTIFIVKGLLGEALYKYWSSRGKKITKEEIMLDLENQAKYLAPFYGIWEGARGKIENEIGVLTLDNELKEAFNYLLLKLENSYLSFIKGLMAAAYNARPAPEHIINVIEYLSGKDFLKNVLNEMYNGIGNYINQLQPQIAQELQQNQPAGQQQGQQVNQPNVQQPSQPPAGQQLAPQQQQALQGGQFRQPPGPIKMSP